MECKRCGAPLEVHRGASIVRCSYCGGHNRVRSMRTLAQQAPVGWEPPAVWAPRHPAAQAQHGGSVVPLPYRAPPRQTSLRNLVLAIALVVVLATVCPLLLLPLLFMGL